MAICQLSESELNQLKLESWNKARSNVGSPFINGLFPDSKTTFNGIDLPKVTKEGSSIELKESRSDTRFTIHEKDFYTGDFILFYSFVYDEFFLVSTKKLRSARNKPNQMKALNKHTGFRINQLRKLGEELPKNRMEIAQMIESMRRK